MRTIYEYIALPYIVEVIRNEDGFFARVQELPGCMTWTDRIEDLWPMVEDAKRAWIEVSMAEGDVPEPRSLGDGAASVRVSQPLYRNLRRRATREGVTVDQLVEKTLAQAMER